mmetsp:Transcript_39409/g.84395  ORF Transcript_39409/g.84395 Transcript_39409/m.84395 type:complete len:244 (+) Transcript_39409:76-807(+)
MNKYIGVGLLWLGQKVLHFHFHFYVLVPAGPGGACGAVDLVGARVGRRLVLVLLVRGGLDLVGQVAAAAVVVGLAAFRQLLHDVELAHSSLHLCRPHRRHVRTSRHLQQPARLGCHHGGGEVRHVGLPRERLLAQLAPWAKGGLEPLEATLDHHLALQDQGELVCRFTLFVDRGASRCVVPVGAADGGGQAFVVVLAANLHDLGVVVDKTQQRDLALFEELELCGGGHQVRHHSRRLVHAELL